MKIKTLAIAAATLAVGAITSQAQVYSQNVVGYVNVITTGAQYALVCNPLDLDGVNNVTNVLPNVPNGTSVLTWNGTTYTTVTRNAGTGKWPAGAASMFLTPGTGFYLKTSTTYTNTFTGTVLVQNADGIGGGTNSSALAGASAPQLVGSVFPISGTVTNAADQGVGTLNLGSTLANGSSILTWNGTTYVTATKNAGTGKWNGNPTIAVGQGFFVKPTVATNWVQVLP